MYFRGHFEKIDIAGFMAYTGFILGPKPHFVRKFRKCQLTEAGETYLNKSKEINKKKHVVARAGDLNHGTRRCLVQLKTRIRTWAKC